MTNDPRPTTHDPTPRRVKRYGSRKLYDTEDSRYVSLADLARLIREGEEIEVIDNDSGDDVTAQTLMQVVLEEGRQGSSELSSSFLHKLVRRGEEIVSSGVEQVQNGVDRIVQASMDRLGPVKEARREMTRLRQRLDELERSLEVLEDSKDPGS